MSSYISWWSKFWYCGILDNSGNFFVSRHWSTWFDNCWFSIFFKGKKEDNTNKQKGGILHITYLFVLFGNYHVAHLFEFSVLCYLYCLSSSRVLFTQCCLCFWIVRYWSYLRFSFTVTMTIVVLFKSCYIQLMSVLFFSLYHALYIDGYLFIL